MAFNFNWTPLITSTSSPDFYSHAKHLLTLALNKSAKSSVIVDSDVTVENLHLGQSAPELEVLEIGDLAEDRFRGVFRMTYDGDALVTVKARVQVCATRTTVSFRMHSRSDVEKVNPLCTYINHTTPSYTSPHPLAAASAPLTIPVQLTLSEFKLSGFVILVFSKEKGITLVFRNDPLESMRVQSSFDSIPFIKNYLQKEIERQVRGLFQEELPLAVYKLSLRLLESDERGPSQSKDTVETLHIEADEDDVDPLYTDTSDVPLFPEKNEMQLQALRNSQQTLSLFTLRIQGAIFRAMPPSSLYRAAPTEIASADCEKLPVRPGLHQSSSSMTMGSGHSRRKRKHRVVNLRKGRSSTMPASEAVSPASSELGDVVTVASAPGCGRNGSEMQLNSRPRKLSLVGERSSQTPSNIQQEVPSPLSSPFSNVWRPQHSPLDTPRPPVRTYEGLDNYPRPSRGTRYPSGIVEKAFMMRFMAEMTRQAVERRDEITFNSRPAFAS
jgi:distribution and morphology protein 34